MVEGEGDLLGSEAESEKGKTPPGPTPPLPPGSHWGWGEARPPQPRGPILPDPETVFRPL